MTKQSEARERVLDLIERLAVGEAIPSERQLDRRARGLATDGPGGARRSGPRGLPRAPARSGDVVSEPKIAQELTMTSFTGGHAAAGGWRPSSRTLELNSVPAGARLGRLLHVSPSEQVTVG